MENNASTTLKAHCNKCRQTTNHQVLKSRTRSGGDQEVGFWEETSFDMLECCGCEEVMLRRSYWLSENDGVVVSYFPPRASGWFLEAALDAGNAAAHRAHVPTAEQMNAVMDIVENLVHSLFVLEKPSTALKDAIPPRPPAKKNQEPAKSK